MKAIRFGFMNFDSHSLQNKKEAAYIYETASFFCPDAIRLE